MRTRKPISTISYNSKDFLLMKLDELIKNHKISDYMYIYHFGEDDESAGKDHFHVWMEPNCQVDTMDLQEFFREYDPQKPNKPKGCISFRNSVTDDWLLYVQHFPAYLASKFEMRGFIYSKDDFEFYDENNFNSLYYHAFYASEWSRRNKILQALNDGSVSPANLIANGTVPLQMASQLNAFKYLQKTYGMIDRGGRENHEKEYMEYYSCDFAIDVNSDSGIIVSDKSDSDDVIYRINR